jgi:hypothetical protein
MQNPLRRISERGFVFNFGGSKRTVPSLHIPLFY